MTEVEKLKKQVEQKDLIIEKLKLELQNNTDIMIEKITNLADYTHIDDKEYCTNLRNVLKVISENVYNRDCFDNNFLYRVDKFRLPDYYSVCVLLQQRYYTYFPVSFHLTYPNQFDGEEKAHSFSIYVTKDEQIIIDDDLHGNALFKEPLNEENWVKAINYCQKLFKGDTY